MKQQRMQVGTVHVESGQVMIVDPCYARSEENQIDKNTGLQHGPGLVDYDKACDLCFGGKSLRAKGDCELCKQAIVETREQGKPLTLENIFENLTVHPHSITQEEHSKIGFGTVASTGIGDGIFPVFATLVGDTIIKLEIVFNTPAGAASWNRMHEAIAQDAKKARQQAAQTTA